MAMRILIDGYNLLHASTILPAASSQGTLEETRNALLDFLIDNLPPGMAEQTVVVFDKGTERGLPAEAVYGQLTVMFALRHPEADDLIEELIGVSTVPKRLTVVSSDHRLQRAARRRRALAVDSEVWLRNVMRRSDSSRRRAEGPALVEGDWQAEFADIDVQAIEREVAAESKGPAEAVQGDAAQTSKIIPPELSKEDAAPNRRASADSPFPDGYGDEELDNELNDSPFPPGYGEDLLNDE